MRSCELKVLSWYAENFADGRALRYSRDDPQLTILQHVAILEAGVPFELVSPEEHSKDPFPHCWMTPAQALCPFVVTTRLDHFEGPVGFGGGRLYVLHFFGVGAVICGIEDHQG